MIPNKLCNCFVVLGLFKCNTFSVDLTEGFIWLYEIVYPSRSISSTKKSDFLICNVKLYLYAHLSNFSIASLNSSILFTAKQMSSKKYNQGFGNVVNKNKFQ